MQSADGSCAEIFQHFRVRNADVIGGKKLKLQIVGVVWGEGECGTLLSDCVCVNVCVPSTNRSNKTINCKSSFAKDERNAVKVSLFRKKSATTGLFLPSCLFLSLILALSLSHSLLSCG